MVVNEADTKLEILRRIRQEFLVNGNGATEILRRLHIPKSDHAGEAQSPKTQRLNSRRPIL